MVGFNFAPQGWALCNGQILYIAENDALFTVIGTTYGGDEEETFALPNLQSRAPVHAGQGPGLSGQVIGEEGGENFVTLLSSEMPAHTHFVSGSARPANENDPNNLYWGSVANLYSLTADPAQQMAPQMTSIAGGSQPHNNLQPFLVLNFCIALQGVFPSRG